MDSGAFLLVNGPVETQMKGKVRFTNSNTSLSIPFVDKRYSGKGKVTLYTATRKMPALGYAQINVTSTTLFASGSGPAVVGDVTTRKSMYSPTIKVQ